jgi:hypothetical protein
LFWKIDDSYMLYNTHTKRCLTMDSGDVGARLRVADCDPNSAKQRWNWTDSSSWNLRSKLGTCIDVPRGEYSNGASPFGYACNGEPNQRWLLTPA